MSTKIQSRVRINQYPRISHFAAGRVSDQQSTDLGPRKIPLAKKWGARSFWCQGMWLALRTPKAPLMKSVPEGSESEFQPLAPPGKGSLFSPPPNLCPNSWGLSGIAWILLLISIILLLFLILVLLFTYCLYYFYAELLFFIYLKCILLSYYPHFVFFVFS